MASRPDAPKKRLTTYGRAGKRSVLGGMRRAESSPVITKVQRAVSETHAQEPAVSQTEAASKSSTPERAAPVARPSPLKKSKTDTDISRAKKRKVEPTVANDNSDSIWSPPSSPPPPPPPPARKTSPKRATRTYGSKQTSAQSSKARASRVADTVSEEVDEPCAPFSAKTARNIRELSIDNKPAAKTQAIPLRLTRTKSPPPTSLPRRTSAPVVRRVKTPEPAAQSRPRKRLIDALAAQAEESSESEEEVSSQRVIVSVPSSPPPGLRDSPPKLIPEPSEARRTFQRQASGTKKPGPKFTYGSQQRTMLAEDSMMDMPLVAGLEEESQPRAPFLGLGSQAQVSQLSNFSLDDDDDTTPNPNAVQALHELRQSGAASRTTLEMDDFMQRIGKPVGKPSSLRRGGLLEMAQKLKEQSFRRQFRNYRGSEAIFANLSDEKDIIAGYAAICCLTILLATSPSLHLVQHLDTPGVASLLLVLLEEKLDIVSLAKDRKRNVMRATQNTISSVKATVLGLSDTWDPVSPPVLSPRTLALNALNLLIQHGASETELLTPTATDKLFAIVSNHADPACWDFPQSAESIDFYSALSLLEQRSISAMQSTARSKWNSDHLPIVAAILGVALERPADKFDDLESLILRLTLNTTNNNHDAGGMFVDKGLLRALAEAACRTFDVVLKSIMDDAFLSKVLDSLILMLGVGINFCEHYPPAAIDLVEVKDGQTSPLDRLIRVFLDYHATTADVSYPPSPPFNPSVKS